MFSYTNYTAVTNNTIIHKTVFSDKVYNYDDVEKLELGFTKGQESNVYYDLVMRDGTKISLIGGSVEFVDESYENVIYEIDSKLQSLGKDKIVDKFYIEDFKNNYISFTDIAKYKNKEEPNVVVSNWMRNYNIMQY